MSGVYSAPMTFSTLENVPWDTWQPQQIATLMFIVEPDRMLLIRKKRGLGKGKINAPGGRVEPGESPLDGAVRESQEELHITPIAPIECGRLSFQFVDGLSLYVHVFRAETYEGEPTETEEARPHWFSLDALPYDEMWADDRLWLPRLLAREPFDGRFLFDGEEMLGHAFSA
ncbi:MAG: 8-oxo-dGTP diphosphatase [Myxococcota bacterium]